MIFSIFNNVQSKGSLCTESSLLEAIRSEHVILTCRHIAQVAEGEGRPGSPAADPQSPKLIQGSQSPKLIQAPEPPLPADISELKKSLPAVTWQAFFPDGERKSSKAVPSGLYMLDIDHVSDPYALWEQVSPHRDALGILVAHKTPSAHGLRLVALVRPECLSIAENQQWLANQIAVPFDQVCKDWARASFLVPEDYFYYLSPSLWDDAPVSPAAMALPVPPEEAALTPAPLTDRPVPSDSPAPLPVHASAAAPQSPAPQSSFRSIPLSEIVAEWFEQNGGIPQPGERNNRLYQLALQLRYICDFNPLVVAAALPPCGLPKAEVLALCKSACSASRGAKIPQDLQVIIDRLEHEHLLMADQADDDSGDLLDELCINKGLPPLPPCFKQWCDAAPDDFKKASILVQLPILGTLGSKLRAPYIDGKLHSPSFQVTLEAPQASGKSFMSRIADYELRDLKEHDQQQRKAERLWNEDFKTQKAVNAKMSKKERDDLLATKPTSLIRYVPATTSITKLLDRTEQAQGLHLFAISEEIDTVYKAFKRGFSNLSDALRCAFDNAEYGQDYATENSYSGIVRLYYNTLYSGTPKALRRFYPDVEDGLVSRVLFVTLPDQFGKPIPLWRDFTDKEVRDMDLALCRLNAVSIQGAEVQPDHVMSMPWLDNYMRKWILAQQRLAIRTNDRTRDQFCRRAAVYGFRSGMLAWFLWSEKDSPFVRRRVCQFAQWIANEALSQHIIRFSIVSDNRNIKPYAKLYDSLPDTFSRKELHRGIEKLQIGSEAKTIAYRWRLAQMVDWNSATKMFCKIAPDIPRCAFDSTADAPAAPQPNLPQP